VHDHRAKFPRLELPKRGPFKSALLKLKEATIPDSLQVGAALANAKAGLNWDSRLSDLVKKTLGDFEAHNFLEDEAQPIDGYVNVTREVRRSGPQAIKV